MATVDFFKANEKANYNIDRKKTKKSLIGEIMNHMTDYTFGSVNLTMEKIENSERNIYTNPEMFQDNHIVDYSGVLGCGKYHDAKLMEYKQSLSMENVRTR